MTFTYMDPERAMKKVRTLQRLGTPYSLLVDERPITDAQLEAHVRGIRGGD